jgi:Flp pilus assembly pilin Flp
MIKWITNFIKDERGAETVEFGVGALTIAGGAAAGFTTLKDNLKGKTDELIDAISVDAN